MNAVEIEKALTELAGSPFDRDEFAFEFLAAFGANSTTIKRLREHDTNMSDVGGVLQRNNAHVLISELGGVDAALDALRESPATERYKARFIVATDGVDVSIEDRETGTPIACALADLPGHLSDLLPLGGIETVTFRGENTIDVRATNQLNKLYLELLKTNPQWGTAEKSDAMNHFMARLIFCFFAEDTQIFAGEHAFSKKIIQMSTPDASDLHERLQEAFYAMNFPPKAAERVHLPIWTKDFPYVNGGLFADDVSVPVFNKAARSYFYTLGALDWTTINPDIFGSMIQAIAEPGERAHLGMHYTSVSNILKVLNPLFLDGLRAEFERSAPSKSKLRALRERLSKIRIFDPACGSGNFLVIAYKELRALEADIMQKLGEGNWQSVISLKNFRGIELRGFAAEIARLALVIAKYQCDVLYLGQLFALDNIIPLEKEHWITHGNALRLDWRELCPPRGQKSRIVGTENALFDDEGQTLIQRDESTDDFENEGGETYICGNPPYVGSTYQSKEQKADMKHVFHGTVKRYASLDYVAAWFLKAVEYADADIAFVATNSLNQGQSVSRLWPPIFDLDFEISFAVTSFKWANLAAHNAGVTVSIVGLSKNPPLERSLYEVDGDDRITRKTTQNINGYLISGPTVWIESASSSISDLPTMKFGNKPTDGGNLFVDVEKVLELRNTSPPPPELRLIRPIMGSREFIHNLERYCLWIENDDREFAESVPWIAEKIQAAKEMRLASRDKGAQKLAERPHQFRDFNTADNFTIAIPRVSSERREYLPVGVLAKGTIVTDLAFALYDAPLWTLALIASKMHLVWVKAVCGKMKTDFRYSNTLGWNTFPVPTLTTKNKEDLTRAAEEILLAREAHFPATIADLYDSGAMPANLRAAHDHNDEIVERIFMGRRFKHDTERLEVLFERYEGMVGGK